jgi:hypothetical protein
LRLTPAVYHGAERAPVHELHRYEVNAARLADFVNRNQVWVVQGGERPCFTSEAVCALGVRDEMAWKDFEGRLAVELRVVGKVDLAHAARTERAFYTVVAEGLAYQ